MVVRADTDGGLVFRLLNEGQVGSRHPTRLVAWRRTFVFLTRVGAQARAVRKLGQHDQEGQDPGPSPGTHPN